MENVVLDGTPYARALLVRYAAYPLKEGKLKIDPLAVKAAYHGSVNNNLDDDPFMALFKQMAPRSSSARSEPLTVDVLPLPQEGRPESFSGGVGDFAVTSAVDRYEVRANEAVTLTLKIEGRGNVSAIQEPKAPWPQNVELYEAKGHAKTGPGGVGKKVFEFLLIPRQQGQITLPSLEISFFDPLKNKYVTKKTEPVNLNVLEGAPGSASGPIIRPRAVQPGVPSSAPAASDQVHYLKPPVAPATNQQPWWRWLYWLTSGTFALLAGLVLWDATHRGISTARDAREARKAAQSRSWQRLQARAREAEAGAPWMEVLRTYELLTDVIHDALDAAFKIGARSLSRSELKNILVDEGKVGRAEWDRLEALLEFAEMVRFATSAGAVSEQTARAKLAHWVKEGQALEGILFSTSEQKGDSKA